MVVNSGQMKRNRLYHSKLVFTTGLNWTNISRHKEMMGRGGAKEEERQLLFHSLLFLVLLTRINFFFSHYCVN